MSDQEFGNQDAHLQALETVKRAAGEQRLGPHRGGYLSQDEYATLIFYWAGEEHEAEDIEAVILALSECAWAHRPQVAGGMAGAALAMCELYPDFAPRWRETHSRLFARVREFQRTPKSSSHWNDYYIAQWFILRRARKEEGIDILDQLLDRLAEGGIVGFECRKQMTICAEQCKPFEIALQKARERRMQKMVVGMDDEFQENFGG